MKINEVERLVGITKGNIRFYEKEGLLTPGRNSENGYRDYSEEDLRTLEKIKLLRRLGVTIEELRALRDGGCTERHARALLRLEDPILRQKALEQILSRQLTVAQTDALVDQLLSPPPCTRTKRTFVVKDVRLFLNTLTRSMALMRSAGVDARCDRQDKDGEILLTIRIPQAIR